MVTQIAVGSITVDVVLKDIKNIHLSVYPPSGRVRIAAPSRMRLDTIRIFAISRLGWIKQQQQKLQEQERETRREYLDRESHYLWGKRYLLRVIEGDEAPSVALKHRWMLLRVRPGTDAKKKQAIGRGMVSSATQGSSAAVDRQMGAAAGGEGRAVLCAADENQMGQL
jgi:predicted metal-dependent hydrolase